LPLRASFEKGNGEIFPEYTTRETGDAQVLITRISSMDAEQRVGVEVDIDALSGTSSSPVYALIARTLNVPRVPVLLRVERPVVFLTSEERSLGYSRSSEQI